MPAWLHGRRRSPSSRRAWIEIFGCSLSYFLSKVALLAEGVDRNCCSKRPLKVLAVALLAEGVDRNDIIVPLVFNLDGSPSSRRAWIEISSFRSCCRCTDVALLAEGVDRNSSFRRHPAPSMQVALLAEGVDRNWLLCLFLPCCRVALLAEGVDRNDFGRQTQIVCKRRPPRGGRG